MFDDFRHYFEPHLVPFIFLCTQLILWSQDTTLSSLQTISPKHFTQCPLIHSCTHYPLAQALSTGYDRGIWRASTFYGLFSLYLVRMKKKSRQIRDCHTFPLETIIKYLFTKAVSPILCKLFHSMSLFLKTVFKVPRKELFRSVAQSCPALCDPIDCSMPGFSVHHQLPELAQTHVHQVEHGGNRL